MATVSVLYFVLIITSSYGFMPTPQWLSLSRPMKGMARKWFIRRAERKGIPWTVSSDSYRLRSDKLQNFYDQVRDPTLEYPSYYKMPFHGYDKGNLNWKAAYEMEASAYSMSSGYWKELEYGEATQYVRGNFTECVLRFTSSPRRILDIGCATGISTSHLAATFPNAECVTGVDLSPHFLAVARDTCERGFPNTEFVHANGESLPFDDHTFDAVCISYVMHELPTEAARKILAECKRVLSKDGGGLFVVDLDPEKLRTRSVSSFRRWAFAVTEPHIEDYLSRPDPGRLMVREGFARVGSRPNDPLNTIWVGISDTL